MPLEIQDLALSDMLFTAAQEVCTSMLSMEIARTETRSDLIPEPPFDGVLSVIGLTGPWTGNGYLRCAGKTACDLASRFLGIGPETVDDDVLDAVGEITNMVVGSVKNLLEDHLGLIQMSIPTVVYGKNISTRNLKTELTIPVVCTYEGGEFLLSLCLARG
jgi:chemotaxis protein CheX